MARTVAIHIESMTPEHGAEYEAMILSCPNALLYASRRYRDFLHRVLDRSLSNYMIALESGRIVGVLPVFISRNQKYGNVINSLPFFGSHGGVLVGPEAEAPDSVKRALVGAYGEYARECGAVAATLVANPLEPNVELYEQAIDYQYKDERIGQLTSLPQFGDEIEARATLLRSFHQKTRNTIRKAQKSDLEVAWEASVDGWDALVSLHAANMAAIGAAPKPAKVFAAMQQSFRYDADYRVYFARIDRTIVAALLVFYFNRTAEYFVPATHPEYRSLQPMSLLVFEAMSEAVRRGCSYWNWGGTWHSQAGVYNFKRRWGTEDRLYDYYVSIRNPSLLELTPEQILDEYPYYFVVPFDRLAGGAASQLVRDPVVPS